MELDQLQVDQRGARPPRPSPCRRRSRPRGSSSAKATQSAGREHRRGGGERPRPCRRPRRTRTPTALPASRRTSMARRCSRTVMLRWAATHAARAAEIRAPVASPPACATRARPWAASRARWGPPAAFRSKSPRDGPGRRHGRAPAHRRRGRHRRRRARRRRSSCRARAGRGRRPPAALRRSLPARATCSRTRGAPWSATPPAAPTRSGAPPRARRCRCRRRRRGRPGACSRAHRPKNVITTLSPSRIHVLRTVSKAARRQDPFGPGRSGRF